MTTSNEVRKEEFNYKNPAYHAYQILHFAFAIIPIIMGIDKFFYSMTNWEQYLSDPFNVFGNASTTMMVVGIVEIIAGIGAWIAPKIFAYIIAIWLLAIIVNLFLLENFYDVALRDIWLFLCALAFGSLSFLKKSKI